MHSKAIMTMAVVLLLAGMASAQIVVTSGSPFFDDFEGNAPVAAGENCPGVAAVAIANGWSNASGDGNEWTPDNGGTPSVGTGPFVDQNPGHSGGIYLYTEASGSCTNRNARLLSPQFDISGLTATQAAFDFWFHMNGPHTGSITADILEQMNSGTDGAATMASDVFNSVGAAFTANHVGSQIEISGSAMGNDGVYDVIGFVDADNVQLSVALAGTESGLTFTHTRTATGVLGPFSGNQGNLWQYSGEVLVNGFRVNFGSDGNDQLITVVINGTTGGGFQSDMAVDSFTFRGDAPAVDFSPTQIIAPSFPVADACIPLGNMESVTVEITNNQAPVPAGTMVPLTLDINSGAQIISEVFMTPALNQGDPVQFTFAMPADLSSLGTNTVSVTYTGIDGVSTNDSITVMFDNPNALPIAPPFFENFDALIPPNANGSSTPPAGWLQPTADGTSDWFFRNNGPGSGNGPFQDHTTGATGVGVFAYTEDSTNEGSNAEINLLTPCIDLMGTTNPILEFWVASNDATDEQNPLAVDVISSGGITLDVVPPIGSTNDIWTSFSVGLAPFIGDVIRVRFRGRNDNPTDVTMSNGFSNDVGLDDISVVDVIPGNGQAPQFGLATLDINNATETNGFGVLSGLNGPYSTTVTSPAPMEITMTGEANQAIILLAGTLSVNTLFFAGIGQLDIDNPNLVVIGNGTAAGFINTLFILDGAGDRVLTLPSSNLVGQAAAFQAIMFNTQGSVISFSNAVDAVFM